MWGFHGKALAGFVLAWSGILAGNVLGDEQPPRLDRWGDPLPFGAVARLGSVRLRMGGAGFALTYSRDGKLLAAEDSEGELHVWSVASGKELAHCPGQCRWPGSTLTFSADDRTLVCVGEGNWFFPFDLSGLSREGKASVHLKKPNPAINYPGKNPAVALASLPDRKTLLSGSIDGEVRLWDTEQGKEIRVFGTIANRHHRYALSPDGKTVAIAPEGKTPALWDVTTGKLIGRMPGREGVLAMAFSPDNQRLAAAIAKSNAIRIYDVAARKELCCLRDENMPPPQEGESLALSLAFHPHGKTLVSLGGHPSKIRIWEVESGELRRSIPVANGDDRVLALSPDGRIVATTGWNNVVRMWELSTGKMLHDDLRQGNVGAVAVSPDSRQVALGGYDGFVRLYERATGAEVRGFLAGPHLGDHVAYTPDGKALFVAVAYHGAKLWNVADGKEIRSFSGVAKGERGFWRAAFSPDGTQQMLALCTSSLQLLNVSDGKVQYQLGETQPPTALAVSPDRRVRLLASGPNRNTVYLWEAASGKKLWVLHNKTGDIASLAFAPDGGLVAMGDYGQCLYLLDAANGKVVRSMIGVHAQALDFSPDGRLLAIGGEPRDVLLLETATGTEVRRLSGHKGRVGALAFSPDGRSLVTGSWDATGLVWDMTGRAFGNRATNVLSNAELTKLWNDLGAASGDKGYNAVWTLVRSGKPGIAFLQTRLLAKRDDRAIARLIEQLDDDAFAVREKASTGLTKMVGIQGRLKAALAKAPSPEFRRRIEAILAKQGDEGDPRLRGLRSVAALEYADLPEAHRLLRRLADQDPLEEVRRAAHRALKRRENVTSRP